MVLVVCQREVQRVRGGGGEGRGQPRERGWDRVDEWGRKKKHVEIVAVTHFCKKEKKRKEKRKGKRKEINQLLLR